MQKPRRRWALDPRGRFGISFNFRTCLVKPPFPVEPRFGDRSDQARLLWHKDCIAAWPPALERRSSEPVGGKG